MQMLANIAFGAALAGVSLGPAGWTDLAAFEGRVSEAAISLLHANVASAPLSHAVDRARASLPHLPGGPH